MFQIRVLSTTEEEKEDNRPHDHAEAEKGNGSQNE
jgi:hypothetical protein